MVVLLAGCGSPGRSGATGAADPWPDGGSTSGAAGACPGAGSLHDEAAPFTSSDPEPAMVYLPACYDADPQRRFPVLYLLHGKSADESQWPDVGVADTADSLIDHGAIEPLVIVMPDGGPSMPDDLIPAVGDRLVPWADGAYRTIAARQGRALGGISRGGRIALLAAAQRPDLFAVVGGHSPAVTKDDATPAVVAGLAGFGSNVAIDAGDGDPLRGGAEDFAAVATPGRAVVVSSGGHNRRYWSEHVADYLRFYGRGLSAASSPPGG